AKLFRIDTSLSTRGTENEKGTGLGLFLCKEFIEKHGGKIWVETDPGKGSTFKLNLPLNINPSA
ncbi:MAG: HAMP domain-containing histidine kinase, partial [Desulfobacterales bacterium]|nr:HAMP domain-containing histidine kinase [Desulfobacterales bacterium]